MIFSENTKYELCSSPFPHIVFSQILDETIYQKILSELPPLDYFKKNGNTEESNRVIPLPHDEILKDERIGIHLKKLIKDHIELKFHKTVQTILKDELMRLYPDVMDGSNPIHYSASLNVNTPVRTEIRSSVRPAHLDNAKVLYVMLFYLRLPDDCTEGADLNLYQYKTRFKGYSAPSRTISNRDVEKVKTIPYRGNNGILFLNSINSIHGVSLRNPGSYPRYYINFRAVCEKPLFFETKYMSLYDKIRSRIVRLSPEKQRQKSMIAEY